MVTPLTREKTFLVYPELARPISFHQQAFNDGYLTGDESEEERKEDLEYLASICDDEVLDGVGVAKGETLLQLTVPVIESFSCSLADCFISLAKLNGWNSFVFIPQLRTAWFPSKNDYPPVLKCRAELKKLLPDIGFAGGLLINKEELHEMLEICFWVRRCCPEVAPIWFTAEGAQWSASMCQYGVLHVHGEEGPGLAENTDLEIVKRCDEQWSSTGAIAGRRLLLDK